MPTFRINMKFKWNIMKKFHTILLSFLAFASLCGADPEVRIYKKIGDRELAVHIFKPEKQESTSPAVVWYHGGGWNPKDRAGQFLEH
jgi:acetyl esterase/lipase